MAKGYARPATHRNGIDFSQSIQKEMKESFGKFVSTHRIGWVARYGPRTSLFHGPTPKKGHRNQTLLSAEEADLLRDELKLMILPVQCRPRALDKLNARTGASIGDAMARWASRMQIPLDVHLWCDLEGKATKAGRNACIEYVQAWSQTVVKAGYRAGLYLARSLPMGLTSADLAGLKDVTSFWRGNNLAGSKTPLATYSIHQHSQQGGRLHYVDKRGNRWPVLFRYDLDTLYTNWAKPPVLWAPPHGSAPTW